MKKLNVSERRVIVNKILSELKVPINKHNEELTNKYNEKITKLLHANKDYKALIGISERFYNGKDPLTEGNFHLQCISGAIRDSIQSQNPLEGIKTCPKFEEIDDAMILAQIDCPDLETLVATMKTQFTR